MSSASLATAASIIAKIFGIHRAILDVTTNGRLRTKPRCFDPELSIASARPTSRKAASSCPKKASSLARLPHTWGRAGRAGWPFSERRAPSGIPRSLQQDPEPRPGPRAIFFRTLFCQYARCCNFFVVAIRLPEKDRVAIRLRAFVNLFRRFRDQELRDRARRTPPAALLPSRTLSIKPRSAFTNSPVMSSDGRATPRDTDRTRRWRCRCSGSAP